VIIDLLLGPTDRRLKKMASTQSRCGFGRHNSNVHALQNGTTSSSSSSTMQCVQCTTHHS